MDGWIGYLPTADEHRAGGYEVELASVVYGPLTGWLYPALPETADEVVDGAVDLVGRTLEPQGCASPVQVLHSNVPTGHA